MTTEKTTISQEPSHEELLKHTNGWLTAMSILCIIFLLFIAFLLAHNFHQKAEIENLKEQLNPYMNYEQRQLESGTLDQ